MQLHYATQLYQPAQADDFARLLSGIERNLRHPFVSEATIFLDGCEAPWERQGVRFLPLDRRADFADFLELMEPADADTPSTHLLFANSDIVFDETIAQVAEAIHKPGHVVCLTRRELDGSYPAGIEPLQTQDAWLLRCQSVSPLLLDQLRSIRLGIAGCEHLFAAAMLAHGYSLWNPCEDCHATHTDPNPVAYEPQGERYWGLYAYVPPCRIEDLGRNDPGVFFSYSRAPGKYYQVQIG